MIVPLRVIASKAKQSIRLPRRPVGLLAMTGGRGL